MRKQTAALASLALAALALTGCSASAATFDGAQCERASFPALEASVTVTGDIGTPSATISTPVRSAGTGYTDLIAGDGPAIESSTQSAIIALAIYSGSTGAQLNGSTLIMTPASAADQFPGLDAAMECATEGSRIALSTPVQELGEGAAAQLGMAEDDAVVAILDVRNTLLPHAEGRHVFNDASGLPSVVRAPDGRPGIIVPGKPAPEDEVLETLIEGEGEKVGDRRPIYHYTSLGWGSRTTSTSWDGGVVFQEGALPEQVLSAVSEATIGSQLLVVLPDESGSATVYVVDVLGVVPEELAG